MKLIIVEYGELVYWFGTCPFSQSISHSISSSVGYLAMYNVLTVHWCLSSVHASYHFAQLCSLLKMVEKCEDDVVSDRCDVGEKRIKGLNKASFFSCFL